MQATRPKALTIVGTGLVALDVVYQDANEAPSQVAAGGTCGNTLAILGALGWKAVPVSRLARDSAASIIIDDLRRWGLDTAHLHCEPLAASPIVIERVRTGDRARHTFSWNCPCCGEWLPRFSPLGLRSVETIAKALPQTDVFFFDRAFPAAIRLAELLKANGALVVFEPSAKGDPAVFQRALRVADIVKYAGDRLARLPLDGGELESLLVEIQTLGASGVRYRGNLPALRGQGWVEQSSFSVQKPLDPAGSGDWFTAGFLNHLFSHSAKLANATKETIDAAVTRAQAMAAWNCRYVGARGGMYGDDWSRMPRDVDAIIRASIVPIDARQRRRTTRTMERICPACSGSTTNALVRDQSKLRR